MNLRLRSIVSMTSLSIAMLLTACLRAENPLVTTEKGPTTNTEDHDGWVPMSQRDETRPKFSFAPAGGARESAVLSITTSQSVGENGWFQKSFPVTGGKYVRFHAVRHASNIAAPHRSCVVRIEWKDAGGKSVLSDLPDTLKSAAGDVPLAEPEHPLDGATDADGGTTVEGRYRVPTRATQAIVELHLQWAPNAKCRWSDVVFEEVAATAPRKVRLATIHYTPTGKSPRANCEEYAGLIADAAAQRADLIVLGETVPYVRVSLKPHEVAEPIPGPTTDYFAGLAKKNAVHIVVGLYERDRSIVYNTAALLGPDGALMGRYRKVCLPHREIEVGITPGNDYPVFQTKFGKVGMMVCYDGFYPEVARELTNRGAEVIAWPVWGCNPLLARARACENHVYVISSTFTDTKSNWMISAIFDHAGEPIAKAEHWGQVVMAEVDLNERHFWRNNLGDFHAMAQRHRPPSPEILQTIRSEDPVLNPKRTP